MQGCRAVAARRIGERLRVIAAFRIGDPVPHVIPARFRREIRVVRARDRQKHRHQRIAAVNVSEETRQRVVFVVFISVPFEEIAGGQKQRHRIGLDSAEPQCQRAVTAIYRCIGKRQCVRMFKAASPPHHRQVARTDNGIENCCRRLQHRHVCEDKAVAARRVGEWLQVRAALRIDAALPNELPAHRRVKMRKAAGVHMDGHHNQAVAAAIIRESVVLGARRVEDSSVPNQRQIILADRTVQVSGVGIVYRQVQPPREGAAIRVDRRMLVNT